MNRKPSLKSLSEGRGNCPLPSRTHPQKQNLAVYTEELTHLWIENNTFPPDEIAVRFHQRLVFIHPFPNGNGRHARLIADMLAMKLGRPAFTWGSTNLVKEGEARATYLDAIRAADNGDMQPLLQFARS